MSDRIFIKSFFRKLFTLVLLTNFLPNALPVSAQTRRANQPKPNQNVSSKKTAPKCSGGWSGTIVYKKTLKDSLESDEPGIRSKMDRIKHKTSRDYNYTGRAVVNGKVPANPVIKTKVNFTDDDLSWGEEKVFDTCNSRESGHWFIIESNDDKRTTAQTSGSAENFNLYVDEMSGTYSFSMRFPKASGKFKREEHTKKSGHCQPQNNLPFDRSTDEATTIEGGSFSINSEKIDPENPNVLSGTKIWGDDGTGAVRSFVFQVTWYFTRCPQELLITDLKFEDMKFPTWDDWQEISEQKGTIDGNLVKIKATVLNDSGETKFADLKFKDTYKGDKWDGARPDGLLENGEVSVRVDAGEEKEVELLWDSSGYSWYDDGRPRLVQRIKTELEENSKKTDELTKNLKVAPKPVVLVHGLWSNWKAWESWQNILTTSHSYDWKAFPVGEKPEKGVMNTGGSFLSTEPTNGIFENSQQLGSYIKYAQEDRNAWHVDIVAHSMGGLISRHYIHQFMPANYQDGKPQVAHLVMLGTPNMGSPCADVMNFAFEMTGKNVEAVRQLRQDVVADFNKATTNRKGVKFSVLAGNPLPTMCKTVVWNDGVVPVPSAKWKIADNAESKNIHTELTGTSDFSAFVKPRLAIGPNGNHLPETPQMPNQTGNYEQNRNVNSFGAYFVNAAYKPNNSPKTEIENVIDENLLKPTFSKAVTLAPNASVEVEIPVEQANDFGLTFMASPEISATLINDRGETVGKNLTKTPEASAWFRSIYVDKNVAAGKWKLKLENTSDRQLETIIAAWNNALK